MSRQVAIHVGAYDYEVPKDVADELARLRAEVEKWREKADRYHQKLCLEIERFKGMTRERDKTLDALSAAQKDLTCSQHEGYKMVWCNCCIEAERTQAQHREHVALAQVAVLDQELARVIGLAKTQVDTENHPPQWSASEFLQLVHQAYRLGPKGFNEKARALLDRLQRAEAVAEAVYYILQHQTEGNWTRLRAVLAAWQEGAA